jgi:hypothetical protein
VRYKFKFFISFAVLLISCVSIFSFTALAASPRWDTCTGPDGWNTWGSLNPSPDGAHFFFHSGSSNAYIRMRTSYDGGNSWSAWSAYQKTGSSFQGAVPPDGYVSHICYQAQVQGNSALYTSCSHWIDLASPIYSSISVKNVNANGYDVYIYGVNDNDPNGVGGSGINRVQCPTWTDANGQDDIVWGNATNLGGEIWYYHVSRHGSEYTGYNTNVYIYDNVGNYTSGVAASNVKLDNTPPSVTFNPYSLGWTKNIGYVTINCTDNDSGINYFDYYINSGSGYYYSGTVYGTSTTVSLSSTGIYSLYVVAYDRAGNAGTGYSGSYYIDRSPPTGYYSPYSCSWTGNQTASITTYDMGSGLSASYWRLSTDGGQTWSGYTCFYNYTTVTLPQGDNVLQTDIYDNAGNKTTITSGHYYIDKTPPSCRVSVAASDWHVGGSSLTLAYSDDLSGVATQQYAWSQSSTGVDNWQNYSNWQKLLPPGSGAWYLYWLATDRAGNTGSGMFGPYANSADLTVKIQTPNAGYLTDTDVITSAYVSDNSETPVYPGDSAVLTLTVRKPDGSAYTKLSKAIVCPANNNNLIWFRWHTPSTAGNYTLTASLTAANVSARAGWTSTLTWHINVPTENAPPQTKLNDTKPSWFSIQTPNPCGYSSALSWSDWIYNSSFIRRTYTATLNAALSVTPTKTADGGNRIVTATQNSSGVWTFKSGYSISESITSGVSLMSSTGSAIDENSATSAQLTEGRYPEFNYYYAGYFRLFDSMGNGSFQLKSNPYSQYGYRAHYIPVWFPNGAYTALATVSQTWTPAGMLGRDMTGTVQVQGSLPDDWYVRVYQ